MERITLPIGASPITPTSPNKLAFCWMACTLFYLLGIFPKTPLDKGDRNGYTVQVEMRLIRNQANQMQGHPLTSQRRLLLELIRQADGHVDAKELYRRASSKDEFISPATVYRSLNLFKQLGLVDERRLGQVRCYYEIKQTLEHQHLVCRGCGKIIEFESPLIRKLVDRIQRNHRFNVTKAELYLEGYCEQCKEKAVPSDS